SKGAEENQLRKNSLGVGAVTFLVVSAAAPLTAVGKSSLINALVGQKGLARTSNTARKSPLCTRLRRG
ncbi:hypothetical protein BBI12_027440, partial [Agrobacterium vitis]|nr:hypothetical protein [Agrobacterium vitis]